QFMGGVMMVLHNLGYVECARNDGEKARGLFQECLNWGVRIQNRRYVAIGLAGLAAAATCPEELHRAALPFSASQSLLQTIDADQSAADQEEMERYLRAVQASLSRDEFDAAWSTGAQMAWEQAVEYVTDGRAPDANDGP